MEDSYFTDVPQKPVDLAGGFIEIPAAFGFFFLAAVLFGWDGGIERFSFLVMAGVCFTPAVVRLYRLRHWMKVEVRRQNIIHDVNQGPASGLPERIKEIEDYLPTSQAKYGSNPKSSWIYETCVEELRLLKRRQAESESKEQASLDL